MLGRSFVIVGAMTLCSLDAVADPATMCSGKYAHAATIVDHAHGQYETLYSGGNHWQRLDHVGPTLDAYRLFRGYPDIKLRARFDPHDRYGDDEDMREREERLWNWGEDPEALWKQISWAVRRDAPIEPDKDAAFWASFGWDIMTAGSLDNPDWWRTTKVADAQSPGAKWLIATARREPALDWMQTVLAGSNAPWANNWLPYANVKTSQLSDYQSLATTAFARYEAGEGVEWLVASAINAPNISSVPRLAAALDKLAQEVATCSASPAGYAAYAASRLAMERHRPRLASDRASFDDMPPGISSYAWMRTVHVAMAATVLNPEEGRRLAAALAPDISIREQSLALLKLYLARTVDEVPLLLSPKMVRAYNLLSADDLATLGRRSPTSPVLINAAFARHVALGNNAKAAALIEDVKTSNPDQLAAIDRIWKGRQPEAVRLALVVLAAPDISSMVLSDRRNGSYDGDYALAIHGNYYAGHRNLPSQYRKIDFLQRDFEVELRLPQRMGAYNTMRGYTIDWMERLKERGGYEHSVANEAPQLFDLGRREKLPFDALIARSELQRLTSDEQLMATVTRRITVWADGLGRNAPDREIAGEALALAIKLCKFNSCSETRGEPVSKRAFLVLKSKLRDTKGARRVRWWYPATSDRDAP